MCLAESSGKSVATLIVIYAESGETYARRIESRKEGALAVTTFHHRRLSPPLSMCRKKYIKLNYTIYIEHFQLSGSMGIKFCCLLE